jgi:voltage-gated potassium channel
MFALVYVMLAQADAAGFSQPMTRVAALYFTVTVLSTVGFGDITAQTDATRIAVTIQMVLDLILVGVVVKVVIGASRIGMARRRATTGAEAEA